MSGLAPMLLGLAAILADRSWRVARRSGALDRIGGSSPPTREIRRAPLRWVAAAAVGWALAGSWGVLLGSAAATAAALVGSRRRSRRTSSALPRQLADAVDTLAAAMRSGRSLPQAIVAASEEADEPLAASLRNLVDALQAGRRFDDAVDAWIAEVGTEEAALVGGTLRIHRRMGGDLPAVLDRIGATLREREQIAAEVRSMTAQARLSGAIVGALPVAFLGVLWLVSRDDVVAGLSTPIGWTAVGLGLALEAGAYLWIRRLLRSDEPRARVGRGRGDQRGARRRTDDPTRVASLP